MKYLLLVILAFKIADCNSQTRCFGEAALDSYSIDWKDKKAFLFGETHGLPINRNIDFELIKFLNQNNSIRNVILEVSPSTAYFFNLYINTGNRKHLIDVELSSPFLPLLDSIKNYNQDLSEKDKIYISGYDFERIRSFTKLLSYLFKDSQYDPIYLSKTLKYLRHLNLEEEERKRTRRNANHLVAKFKKSVKNNLPQFEYSLKTSELAVVKQIFDLQPNPKNRNKSNRGFYDLIMKYSKFSDGFYCVMGSMHTNRKNKASLTNLLEQSRDSPYRDKTISFYGYYTNVFVEGRDTVNMGHLDWFLDVNTLESFSSSISEIQNCSVVIARTTGIVKELADYIIVSDGEEFKKLQPFSYKED